MKSVDIWMPLYIGDFHADTARLTTRQIGAYLQLLMDYWRAGPLPDDDNVLAQVTKLRRAQWRHDRVAIDRLFTISDGRWIHPRMDKWKQKAHENRDKKSAAGILGAQERWKDKMANGMAKPLQDYGTSSLPSASEKPLAEIGFDDAASDDDF